MIARRVPLQFTAPQRARMARLVDPHVRVSLHCVRVNDWQAIAFEDRIPTLYESGYGASPVEAIDALLDKLEQPGICLVAA